MKNKHTHTNRLIHETSPYLLQHAHNPVDWYAWGEEAFEKAQREDKLILVSIGYAACHWCHVMERESFEQEEVARLMNERFVCVKVDREERPDVDKIYMDAVVMINGHGGWPLNCFALPDGRPLTGGTYFPKQHWMRALIQLSNWYRNKADQALSQAEYLTQSIQKMADMVKSQSKDAFTQEELSDILTDWLDQIDFEYGGRLTSANKFPLPTNNLFLLRVGHLFGHKKAQEAVDLTLNRMALGGLYDQVGGGFARYSVDVYWKVPHFEKMLYDNGQLVSLYAEAYQQSQKPLYKHVVYQSLAFVERELTSPEGGFYSSLDADSEGVEGKFYMWTQDELVDCLGRDKEPLFSEYYHVQPHGNWEHSNILFAQETEEAFAKRKGIDVEGFKQFMADSKARLLEVRSKRIRPGLDDKILTSWNAMMLKAYVDAYRVFGEVRFLDMAMRNAAFIQEKVTDGGMLFRNYKEGRRSITGFLDDYAWVIRAYLSLYEVGFEEKWIVAAERHLAYTMQYFYDEEKAMFYYTPSNGEKLVARSMETADDVIPASNSVMAENLRILGLLTGKEAYRALSEQMLQNIRPNLFKSPAWHANWANLMLTHIFPTYEVAITGKGAHSIRKAFGQYYLPNCLFAGATEASELSILANRLKEGTHIYVCQDQQCQLPVQTVEAALAQLQ